MHNNNNNLFKNQETSEKKEIASNSEMNSLFTQRSNQVLLSTAVVVIQNTIGKQLTVRAILDSGSQSSFIVNNLARKLKLTPNKVCTNIRGLGQSEIASSTSMVSFTLISRVMPSFILNIDALTVATITDPLPHTPINSSQWAFYMSIS